MPDYSYDDLVLRAQIAQMTIRSLLNLVDALEEQLKISAALAEATIEPVHRKDFAQFFDDMEFCFATVRELTPDAEKLADILWEEDLDEDDFPSRPILSLFTGDGEPGADVTRNFTVMTDSEEN